MDIVRHSFCAIKNMHQSKKLSTLKKSLKKIIGKRLRRIDMTTSARRPLERHIKRTREIFDVTYFNTHENNPHLTEEEKKAIHIFNNKRRKIADGYMAHFQGDPDDRCNLLHFCPGDDLCCTDATKVDVAYDKAEPVVMENTDVPALNKWKTLPPVFGMFSRGFELNGLGRDMWQDAFGSGGNSDSDSDISADAAVGAADDRMASERKAAKVRARKAVRWVQKPVTPFLLLLWLLVNEPIQGLHNYLFAHGKFYDDTTDGVGALVNFCSGEGSKAGKALDQLNDMFRSGRDLYREAWGVVKGHMWDDNTTKLAAGCVAAIIANVWRRLIVFFKLWPWMLGRLVDPGTADDVKHSIRDKFLAAKTCCVCYGFCRKLKTWWGTRALWDANFDDINCFLQLVFDNAIIVTDHVELGFAHMRQFITKSLRPVLMSTLSSNHCNREYTRIHSRALGKKDDTRRTFTRPMWTRRGEQRIRLSAFNIWVRNRVAAGERFPAAQKSWRHGASAAAKRACRSEAQNELRARNNMPNDVDAYLDQHQASQRLEEERATRDREAGTVCPYPWGNPGTPWQMGDELYPLAVRKIDAINKEKGGIRSRSKQWIALHMNDREPLRAPSVQHKLCGTYLPLGECKDDLGDDFIGKMSDIKEEFRLCLSGRGGGKRQAVLQLLAVHHDGAGHCEVVASSSHLTQIGRFETETMRCSCEGIVSSALPAVPFQVDIQYDDTTGWPVLERECDIAARLARVANAGWRYSMLQWKPVEKGILDKYLVVEVRSIDVGILKVRERLVTTQNAAMRVFKAALSKIVEGKKDRNGGGVRRGRGGGGRGQGRRGRGGADRARGAGRAGCAGDAASAASAGRAGRAGPAGRDVDAESSTSASSAGEDARSLHDWESSGGDDAKDDAKDDAEMDLDAEERKSWRDAKDEQNKSERRTAVRERRSSDDATSERAKKRYDLLVASGMTLVPSGMEGFDISTTGWVYAGFHEVGRVTDVSSGRGRGWYGYCTRHTACKVWADVSHCDNPRQLILTWLKDGMTIANKVAHQSCWSEMYRPAAVP